MTSPIGSDLAMTSVTEAIVVLEADRAVVTTIGGSTVGAAAVVRSAGASTPDLGRVVHEIGDADRVSIVGPRLRRLDLERAYVAISHRPDRLRDLDSA
ncbi:MAG TPA: hypothetical protein VGI98_04325 [Candidatus Limnocylindrales bacterium]|jgi:hypothetical protein